MTCWKSYMANRSGSIITITGSRWTAAILKSLDSERLRSIFNSVDVADSHRCRPGRQLCVDEADESGRRRSSAHRPAGIGAGDAFQNQSADWRRCSPAPWYVSNLVSATARHHDYRRRDRRHLYRGAGDWDGVDPQ